MARKKRRRAHDGFFRSKSQRSVSFRRRLAAFLAVEVPELSVNAIRTRVELLTDGTNIGVDFVTAVHDVTHNTHSFLTSEDLEEIMENALDRMNEIVSQRESETADRLRAARRQREFDEKKRWLAEGRSRGWMCQ